MQWENALDSFAVGNSPDGERFIHTAALTADHDPGEDLDSFLISFDYAGMHLYAVANFEFGAVLLLLFFNEIDNAVHKRGPGEGRAFTLPQAWQKASRARL